MIIIAIRPVPLFRNGPQSPRSLTQPPKPHTMTVMTPARISGTPRTTLTK